MNPLELIEHYYDPETTLYRILVDHSRKVTDKALAIARSLDNLNPDLDFISSAAMLHDIGIFLTRSRSIGCTGEHPYVCHGYLGRELLDKEGLPEAYGLVCERHTGAGITKENILANSLPLPHRDMVPVSLEEKIICCADKYFSKSPKKKQTLTTAEIIKELGDISADHADRFKGWIREFNIKQLE